MDADLLISEQRTCSEHEKEALPMTSLSLAAFILAGAGVLLVSGPYRMQEEEVLDDQYRDPDFLRDFFGAYQGWIRELGTPRRIKRFCNKVRYQATCIQEKGENVRLAYLELLLYVELYGSNDSLLEDQFKFREFVQGLLERSNSIDPSRLESVPYLRELSEEDLEEVIDLFYEENRSILF
jgi:hypothetical protein